MTQDAPLDQKAPIDADVLRKLVPGFRLDWSGLRNRFNDIAARLDKLTTYESRAAYLDEIARNFEDAVSDALSRRVPASGGEADFWHNGMNQVVSNAEREGWRGTSDEDMIGRYCEPLYASPIVAAPEGWTPEKYAEQLAVSLREKHYPEVPQFEPMTGDIMGLLSQIDNMTTGLSRSIPEGKAEPGEAAAIERCAKVADGVRQRLEAGRNGKPLGQIDEHAASIADSIAQKIRALSTPPGAP